jgi:hypothetical protein
VTVDFAFPAVAHAHHAELDVSGRRGGLVSALIGGESDHFDTELVPVEYDDAAMWGQLGRWSPTPTTAITTDGPIDPFRVLS